ncbi:unnamed protein product [Ilex paraguariensis]|uniref:Uncharacterized protein n=1 Tax=Ilex paraguariensis TaxID=185542 RepID=A0ABC8TV42_9AQUA
MTYQPTCDWYGRRHLGGGLVISHHEQSLELFSPFFIKKGWTMRVKCDVPARLNCQIVLTGKALLKNLDSQAFSKDNLSHINLVTSHQNQNVNTRKWCKIAENCFETGKERT